MITKSEMLNNLVAATGLKKKDVQAVLDAQISLIVKSLKKDKKFKLQGMGIFAIKKRAARMARNPQTGATVKVPAKTVIKFRIGKEFKTSVLG